AQIVDYLLPNDHTAELERLSVANDAAARICSIIMVVRYSEHPRDATDALVHSTFTELWEAALPQWHDHAVNVRAHVDHSSCANKSCDVCNSKRALGRLRRS